jgi:hypothetical protein
MKPRENYIQTAILLFFLALAAPLALIPIEKIFPYPYIAEELAKFALILLVLRLPSKIFQAKVAIFVAFLFAFSENFFYLSSFIGNGISSLFFYRFLLTSILHISTALIILIPIQKTRHLAVPALAAAISIHYLYNELAISFF